VHSRRTFPTSSLVRLLLGRLVAERGTLAAGSCLRRLRRAPETLLRMPRTAAATKAWRSRAAATLVAAIELCRTGSDFAGFTR
jgi:hypothetical protein